MKKSLLIIALIFVICLNISTANIFIVTKGADGVIYAGKDAGGNNRYSTQSFNVTGSTSVTGFRVYGNKDGDFTDFTATLRRDGTSGTSLGAVTLNLADFNTSSAQWQYFKFSSPISLDTTTGYIMHFTVNSPSNAKMFGFSANNSNGYTTGYACEFVTTYTCYPSTWDIAMEIFTGSTSTPPSLTLASSARNNDTVGFLDFPTGIYTFNVNGTSVNNSNTYTGLLYINGVLNQSLGSKNLSLNHQINISFIGQELFKNITLTFYNENASSNISYLSYFDGVNPEIAVTNLVNNTAYFKNISLEYFNYSVQFADNNLFAYNITLKNAAGVVQYNNFTTGITTTTYNLTKRLNLSNNATGNYTMIFETWDSHTANQIKPLEWYFDGNNLISDGDLRFIGDFKALDAKSKPATYFYYSGDRYKFKVTFNNQAITHTIRLQTSKMLELVSNSKYKGHFVYWGIVSPRWVDFESANVASVSVVKNAPNDYTLTVTHYTATDEIEFNSIGDLNKATLEYNFTINNPQRLFLIDNNTATAITDFEANIFNATYSTTISTTSGSLYLPITSGVYNITFASTGYLNRTYSEILSPGGTLTGSLNASGAFTVYIKNELTLSLISQLVNLEFIPQTANESKNYTTSTGVKYISDLSPGEYVIRYSSVNYSNAFYYFTLVNGTNEQFTVYMLPDTQTDNVTAYVYDEVANPVSDAIIHVQRYDLNTNSYITVEIVKTNFEGRAIIHVTKNTEFYKFLIYYNGNLELNTDASYIYDDTIAFQIYIGDQFASDFFEAYGVDYTLYFNPATQNAVFVYADPNNAITNGTLKLFNATSGALVNISSVASTSGTILLFARNTSSANYEARAYVKLNGKEYYLTSLSIEYPAAAPMQEDGSALFYVILLTIVFMFIGFFDLTIAVILTPLPCLVTSLLGLIALTPAVTIPMQILALIIAYLININKG